MRDRTSLVLSDADSSICDLLQLLVAEADADCVLLVSHPISEDLIPSLYEELEQIGHIGRMYLVLSTQGGSVSSARRLAHLLRAYCENLEIFVPYCANSAGTLICFSGNQIIMSPMSELSPIDPQISAVAQTGSQTPGLVSSREVREFQSLASEWFGVERPEDALQTFALIAQRFFPATLTSLYRSEHLVREIALDLLAWQIQGAGASARRAEIVEHFISGFRSHDYPVLAADARTLGLEVRQASESEQHIGWRLRQITAQMSPPYLGVSAQPRTVGLVANSKTSQVRTHRYSVGRPDDNTGSEALIDSWTQSGTGN